MPRALVVEDEGVARDAVRRIVESEGYQVITASNLDEARRCLAEGSFRVALLDLELPDGQGLDLLPALSRTPGTEIVFVTGRGSVDSAVRALQGGAIDYLEKPVDVDRLRKILRDVHATLDLRGELDRVRERIAQEGRLGPLLGASPAMKRVYDLIVRVAPTRATVLVTGATGTGKELVAQTLHLLSERSAQPFLAVNCGAMTPTLVEAELFGHERGAFTGADRRRLGLFERAHRGTLFLDELTEMPLELQVKLLRVLETGVFERLGGEEPVVTDVRVIAASHREPRAAVRAGLLREDLYYRLSMFRIDLPRLADRAGDVALLARELLATLNERSRTAKRLSDAAVARLESHGWPGNVRELQHVVERGYILADDEIDASHLLFGDVRQPADSAVRAEVGTSIRTMERALIFATLEQLNGDKPKAAELLGISLKTLYNRLNDYKREPVAD